jgi:ABC-2 type transport system ATP-binding protein
VNVIESCRLSKRYFRTWALRGCNVAIPAGRVVALVGPNGAGKTTLLSLAAGLLRPTAGTLSVLGGLRPGSDAARAGIGFVGQDAALYRHLPAGDMLELAGKLNLSWDGPVARARLAELGIPLDRRVGALSGGQRAQLALTIALAKRPALLVLDEPLASLDPLARHDFMAAVLASVAQDGVSVVFSSHVISELEPVADYLIVLNQGQVQVAAAVDELLAAHRVLIGPSKEIPVRENGFAVLTARQADVQTHLLVKITAPGQPTPAGWLSEPAGLTEIVLAYLRDPASSALPVPLMAAAAQREPA